LEFPDFDPLGGGVDADILFLLEKPGPKTSKRGGGSGFVSPCNDDPTAEASWHFLQEAGIEMERTCHWNVIPGWDGNREQRSEADVRRGLGHLSELLGLLSKLRVAVLLGNKAHKAEALLRDRGLQVVKTIHPSGLARASYPDRWQQLGREWAKAREFADRH
jgi:uracil-DNA glycosylase